MLREIADSDDENDFNIPTVHTERLRNLNDTFDATPSTIERDLVLDVCFDQFLSPTQRISFNANQERPFGTDGSTDRFLDEVAPLSSGFVDSASPLNHQRLSSGSRSHNSPKRSHSETGDGYGRDAPSGRGGTKRMKTYGSSRSHQTESGSLGLSTFMNSSAMKSASQPEESADQHSDLANEVSITRQADNFGSVNPGFSTNGWSARDYMTTMQSSMGGYQSINLDLSTSGQGYNVNPFGSLSQVSLDGETNPAEIQRFASFFRNPITNGTTMTHGGPNNDDSNLLEEFETSSVREVNEVQRETTAKDADGPTFSQLTEDPHIVTEEAVLAASSRKEDTLPTHEQPEHELLESTKPAPKKRGRKPKVGRGKKQAFAVADDEPDELALEGTLKISQELRKPQSDRSHAGTIDPGSQTSHASQGYEAMNQKSRKRKMSTPEAQEEFPKKQPSSELHLDNEDVIGIPKEQYVPRPTKRRSKAVDEELSTTQKNDEVIALAADVDLQVHETEYIDDIQIAEPTPAKKKAGRKSKVKHLKTTPSILSKQAVLEEVGDAHNLTEEVKSTIDSRTQKATLSYPAIHLDAEDAQDTVRGIRSISKEPSVTEIDEDQEIKVPPLRKLTVEVPTMPKHNGEPTARSGSKKRGRKPKKPIELEPEPEPEPEPELEHPAASEIEQPKAEEEDPTNTDRLPLAEKDINTTIPDHPSSAQPALKHPSPSDTIPALPTINPPSKATSPLKSATPLTSKYRIGLSKRHSIPSLLRKVDRTRDPPKLHERKEKLTKKQAELEEKRKLEREDAGDAEREAWEVSEGGLRGKDGLLVEWDD